MTILYEPPVTDIPPMDVVKCQCDESCPLSDPCNLEATGDDLLCTFCREAKEQKESLESGVFSKRLVEAIDRMISDGASIKHCHKCDMEFNREGDGNAPS